MAFNLGIIISGRGSNMLNIINACQNRKLLSRVSIVISNVPDAEGLKIAQKKNIKTLIIDDKKQKTNSDFEGILSKSLIKENVNLVCLAGFMKILSKGFIKKWGKKIINIHPSLLPSFKGINAVEQALKYKVKYTGCTLHYVNERIDSGEIIDQKTVKILKNETLESLKKKILIEEHKLYINVLRYLERKFFYGKRK